MHHKAQNRTRNTTGKEAPALSKIHQDKNKRHRMANEKKNEEPDTSGKNKGEGCQNIMSPARK
jgi:hypothetical protein